MVFWRYIIRWNFPAVTTDPAHRRNVWTNLILVGGAIINVVLLTADRFCQLLRSVTIIWWVALFVRWKRISSEQALFQSPLHTVSTPVFLTLSHSNKPIAYYRLHTNSFTWLKQIVILKNSLWISRYTKTIFHFV